MPAPRENHTIILPIGQEEYQQIVPHFAHFRNWIDEQFRQHPEFFPQPSAKDTSYTTKKLQRRPV